MNPRQRLAERVPRDALDDLVQLIGRLRAEPERDKPIPGDAIDVIRELAHLHIRHLVFHADRLASLGMLLASTFKDPKRSFHGGQLNVAAMFLSRIAGVTCRVSFDTILEDEPETEPEPTTAPVGAPN